MADYVTVGLFLVTGATIAVIWKLFSRNTAFVSKIGKRCVLVSGCDSGFGYALIKRLDTFGGYAFAGCYTESGLAKVKDATSSRIIPLRLDITNADSIRQAYDFVCSNMPEGAEFWGVVNNAGILGAFNFIEFTTIEQWRATFETNLFGMVEVTKAFLPLIKKSKGRVVNMSSAAARLAIVQASGYTASKFAVRGFTDCLRRNMATWGVKVCMIEPGLFATSLVQKETLIHKMDLDYKNAPPSVREQYDDEWLEKVKAYTVKTFSRGQQNLNPVVDCYLDALFCQEPKSHYRVGTLEEVFATRILPLLPTYLRDAICSLDDGEALALPASAVAQ